MKSLVLAVASLLVLNPALRADWVIEAKIESPQMNSNATTKIKGDKIRSDMATGPMGAMTSIIDTVSGESVQLMHGQKMAMKTSGAQMKQMMEMAKQAAGAKPDGAPAKPQATGQKEKVGEFDCEIWTWSSGNLSSKFWVATNHPQADALKEMEKKMRSGILSSVAAGADTSVLPGPAIKTETDMAGMKSTMTILSIKEQTLEPSEFDVPAGYQTMAMPSLPGAK